MRHVAFDLFLQACCYEKGLIARALWETVALAPPLCTTQEEADHMADTLIDSLREIG